MYKRGRARKFVEKLWWNLPHAFCLVVVKYQAKLKFVLAHFSSTFKIDFLVVVRELVTCLTISCSLSFLFYSLISFVASLSMDLCHQTIAYSLDVTTYD
jgi:hypothetical protein